MTAEQARLLDAFVEGTLSMNELLQEDPLLHQQFVVDDLVDELMHAFEYGETGVNLDYWYGPSTFTLRESGRPVACIQRECGTTACIAGHIALLLGASFVGPKYHQTAYECTFLGRQWYTPELATAVWEATYPAGDHREFHGGIHIPDWVSDNYVDGGALTLDALRSFLRAAANLPDPPTGVR